ncbi:hypothetical protein RUND412_004242 [Rhizina undulata]
MAYIQATNPPTKTPISNPTSAAKPQEQIQSAPKLKQQKYLALLTRLQGPMRLNDAAGHPLRKHSNRRETPAMRKLRIKNLKKLHTRKEQEAIIAGMVGLKLAGGKEKGEEMDVAMEAVGK